jgi:hypothetical protein
MEINMNNIVSKLPLRDIDENNIGDIIKSFASELANAVAMPSIKKTTKGSYAHPNDIEFKRIKIEMLIEI